MSITGRQKLTVYLATLSLMLFVAGVNYWDGADSATILWKVMFCPIYLLAGHGLSALFPAEMATTRHWLVELERHLLDGLLFASFVVIVVLPKSSPVLQDQLEMLSLFLLVYVLAKCAFSWRKPKAA